MGPGYPARAGVIPPPADRARFLHDVFRRAMDTPAYKKFLEENQLHVRPGYLSPEAAVKFAEGQLSFFTEVLKDLGYLR